MRMRSLVRKEFKLFLSDKRTMFLAIILPPLLIGVFGAMGSRAAEDPHVSITVAVVSYDSLSIKINGTYYANSSYEWPFIYALGNNSEISLVDENNNSLIFNASADPYAAEKAHKLLIARKIDGIVAIPREFSEALSGINGTYLPIILDTAPEGSDSSKTRAFLRYITESITQFMIEENITTRIIPQINEEFQIPPNKSRLFTYAMAFATPMVMMSAALALTILVVVNERPIPRLVIATAPPHEIILSKFIVYCSINAFQALLIVLAFLPFNPYVAGSWISFYFAIYITGLASSGIGILISTLSSTELQANQFLIGLVIISLLLSGLLIPIENMAPWLQVIAYALPMAHAVPLFTDINIKGRIFPLEYALPLIGIFLVTMTIAIVAFIIKAKRFKI